MITARTKPSVVCSVQCMLPPGMTSQVMVQASQKAFYNLTDLFGRSVRRQRWLRQDRHRLCNPCADQLVDLPDVALVQSQPIPPTGMDAGPIFTNVWHTITSQPDMTHRAHPKMGRERSGTSNPSRPNSCGQERRSDQRPLISGSQVRAPQSSETQTLKSARQEGRFVGRFIAIFASPDFHET